MPPSPERVRVRAALATVVLAVVGMVVGTAVDRATRAEYAEVLASGPSETVVVQMLMSTKQGRTVVGFDSGGRRRTVDVDSGSHHLVFGQPVVVHRGRADSTLLAIEGTEAWTWWGMMTRVFGAAAVLAAAVAAWISLGHRIR